MSVAIQSVYLDRSCHVAQAGLAELVISLNLLSTCLPLQLDIEKQIPHNFFHVPILKYNLIEIEDGLMAGEGERDCECREASSTCKAAARYEEKALKLSIVRKGAQN